MIVDAQGNQRYDSRGFLTPGLNVSDRSYFIAQRDGTAAGLFMSEPIVTRFRRPRGRRTVAPARPMSKGEEFAGVVTATVDLDDLQRFYRAVNLGTGSSIQLVRSDGTLLARNPLAPDASGKVSPLRSAPASLRARLS